MNLYGFAGGDPVNFSDPFGLCVTPGTALICVKAAHDVAAVGAATLGALAQTGVALATTARAIGQAGELAAGIVKNTSRIASATATAAYRIPDELTATMLGEVKNVSKLSLTNQLRDFAAYTKSENLTMELWTRAETKLSGPLQQFIIDNKIVPKKIEQ